MNKMTRIRSENCKELSVLYVINSLLTGGAERSLINSANWLAQRGWDVTIVSLGDCSTNYTIREDIKVYGLALPGGKTGLLHTIVKNIKRVIKLRTLVKSGNYKCLVSYLSEANVISILASSGLKNLQVVISERGLPSFIGIKGTIRKVLYRYAEGHIFQTEGARTIVERAIGRQNIAGSVVLPNAVWENTFPEHIESEYPLIVSVGRLSHVKNYELLIDAFAIVQKQIPQAKLTIFGEGEKHDTLKEKIDSMELNDNILLHPVVKNILSNISNAWVCVNTSFSEGYPNSLIEALSVGIPVVATDSLPGAIRELIKPDYGTIVGFNVEELAKAIIDIINNKDRRLDMSNAALNVRVELHKDLVMEKYEKFLISLSMKNVMSNE